MKCSDCGEELDWVREECSVYVDYTWQRKDDKFVVVDTAEGEQVEDMSEFYCVACDHRLTAEEEREFFDHM